MLKSLFDKQPSVNVPGSGSISSVLASILSRQEPVKVNPADTFAADIHAALRLAMAKHSCRAVVPFAEAVEAGYADLDEYQRKAFEEMRDALMTVFEYVVPAEVE